MTDRALAPTSRTDTPRSRPFVRSFVGRTPVGARKAAGRDTPLMSDEQPEDRTRAGLFGDIAGKAKEAVGDLLGKDDLAEDGREQQAQVQADEDELQAQADADS